MYDAKTNEILFPLLIGGNKLGGIEHTYNSINGGAKSLSDLNLIQNKFFGGKIQRFGLILEYGFYACPHYETKKIEGFYIDDPEMITELGKKVLQEKFPTAKIIYKTVTVSPQRVMTSEEIQKKKELLSEAAKVGLPVSMLEHSAVDELDGLLRAHASGVNEKAQVSVEDVKEVVEDIPVKIVKGKPQ